MGVARASKGIHICARGLQFHLVLRANAKPQKEVWVIRWIDEGPVQPVWFLVRNEGIKSKLKQLHGCRISGAATRIVPPFPINSQQAQGAPKHHQDCVTLSLKPSTLKPEP